MQASALRGIVFVGLIGTLLGVAGCGGGGGDESPPQEQLPPPVSNPPPVTPPPDPPPDPGEPPAPPPAHKNLFTPVSESAWDETAVRKVLHTFAFGGQTNDAQIFAWADMAPEFAIEEMLTFAEHNPRLSTPVLGDTDALIARGGTLRELAEFWASDDPANGVRPEDRSLYHITNHNGALPAVWVRAAISRGLNPFRQKIGLWETNYHMAVNQATVPRAPVLRYYDDIMEAHEAGLPYQQVIGVAAASAAIALQYGHRSNRFRNDVCDCNEDFAREYHQLFFGILGVADPNYHETVTIKNTAKAFTDMSVYFDDEAGTADEVDFGTFFHPTGPLEILGQMIGGTDASERIAAMVEISIEHPESLANLPVTIVRDLADDNLDSRKMSAIRNAWAAMDEKNLLTFLRGYAISTIFHESSRVKYWNSMDRHVLLANLVGASNREHYLGLYAPRHFDEDMQIFMPTHNVFGSQTGLEAASSDLVFRSHHGLVTRSAWRFRASNGTVDGIEWEKDWAAEIPRSPGGGYIVKDVAEWLWQLFIADNLKNFKSLERAHVYALLGDNADLAYLLDPDDADRVLTTDDVLIDPAVITLVNDLAGRTLDLGSAVTEDRQRANRQVGMAINFIVGTPYIFAQEGR